VTGASEREATDAGRQKSLLYRSHCFLRAAFLIRPRYFQSALPLDVSLSIGSAAASATDDVVCFADEPFPSSGNNQPSIFAFLPGPRTKGSARMKNSNNLHGWNPNPNPCLFPPGANVKLIQYFQSMDIRVMKLLLLIKTRKVNKLQDHSNCTTKFVCLSDFC
jgi:hypothetical protein